MLSDASPSELVSVLNAVDVGIVVLDRDFRIVFWNDWMARVTHAAQATVTGKTIVELFPSLQTTRLPLAIEDRFTVVPACSRIL